MAAALAELERARSTAGREQFTADSAWRLVWQLAGVVGIEPGQLTLRELVWMAEGVNQDHWNHTSAILAMLANVNRDPKKGRAFKPADFHPIPEAKVAKQPPLRVPVSLLKTIFVDRAEG